MDRCVLTLVVDSKSPICIKKDGIIEYSNTSGGKHVVKMLCQKASPCEVEVIQFTNQYSDSLHSVVGNSDISGDKEAPLLSRITSNYYVHCFITQHYTLNLKKDSALVILIESTPKEYTKKQYISFPRINVVKDKNHIIKKQYVPSYFPSKKIKRQLFLLKASLPILASLLFLAGIILLLFWIYNTMNDALYIFDGELVFTSFFWRQIIAPLGTSTLLLSYIVYQWIIWVKFKDAFY